MKRFIWFWVVLTFVIVAASIEVQHSSAQSENENLQQPANEIPTLEHEDSSRVKNKEFSLSEKLREWWDSLTGQERAETEEYDADIPPRLRGLISEDEYFRLRSEYFNLLRGIDPENPLSLNPNLRTEAIEKVEKQDERLKLESNLQSPESVPVWTNIGPAPLSNGQTQQYPAVASVSGRTTSVVVDPTNSNKVYIGTAQGGVWRSLDGGTNWSPIFDNAQTLAVGTLALAPSNPSILYVGTGEGNNSGDCFFGVGLYRIDNADTSATLVGPINPSITTGTTTAITYNVFTGRSVTKILVDPTNPATIFVSTATGIGGVGGNALSNTISPLALRGVFRSTNATAAAGTVTFQKLIVNTDGSLDAPGTGNTSIFDMVLEPGNPNNLLVTTQGNTGNSFGGQIYRSTDALAATPTFTSTLSPGFNGLVMKLAINKVGAVVTAYCATNEPTPTGSTCANAGQSGRVRKSIDGGVTWSAPLAAAEGYCGGQCSYDNPIGVNPNNANNVYIGGNARGTCSDVLKRSADGGATFTRDDTGLHADSHYIFFDSQTPTPTVWFANDGGIWKRPDAAAGTAWLNQNRALLSTMQFQSVAVHPTDRNFTIGGTQDNGTEAQQTTPGNWLSAESGDGGFALIDQSATDTTNVTMYHTFFNRANNLIGFNRTNLGACLAVKDSWESRGANFGVDATLSCDGTVLAATNGIAIADTVLFYAPMALGPGGAGNPNTLYFGTQRLYRSVDRGNIMTTVSQNPIVAAIAISAIGISPQSDNTRIVGLQNGKAFATTTGSPTLVDTGFVAPTNATASTTNKFISRATVDPANSNTAYITLAYYTNPSTAGQVWKTTNLNSATPTWTSISGNGAGTLPNIPVNGFAIDRNDPNFPGVSVLYVGTDIGVFSSTDGGAYWTTFGTGLPRVAVFDMAIQPTSRVLRIATHGRGMFETQLPLAPSAPSYEADISPRPSGNTVIDSDDIQQIRRFSVGLDLPYQSNELLRSDSSPLVTSGDGIVDADDIQQVRRYSVGLDTKQLANGPLTESALLFEDWNSIGKTQANAPTNLRLASTNATAGQQVAMPIRVDATGNEAGMTFSLSYEGAKLSNPVVSIGTAGGNVLTNITPKNPNANPIGFSVDSFAGGTLAAGTNQLLVTVRFTVAAGAAGETALRFGDAAARRKVSGANPDAPLALPSFTDGTLTISVPAAVTALSGRVTTAQGRGVRNVMITMSDANGQIKTTMTSTFGYYRFEDIKVGETYIVRARDKRFSFSQPRQALSVGDEITDVNFNAFPN